VIILLIWHTHIDCALLFMVIHCVSKKRPSDITHLTLHMLLH